MLKTFKKSTKSLSLFLLSGALLASCSNLFNEPVKEFFKDYTETAAIEEQELNCSYLLNSSEIRCIGSDENKSIIFKFRNPQNYNLTLTYEFDSIEAQSQNDSYPYSYTWNAGYDTATFNFKSAFLKALDSGTNKDISGKVTLYEPNSGRTFESYPVTLHVNTAPPAVQNACFQLSAAENGTYIICFYLPNVNYSGEDMCRHSLDTRKIYINGQLKYFKNGQIYTNTTYNETTKDWDFSDVDEDTAFSNSYSGTLYPTTSDGYKFPGSDGCPSGYDTIYYTTGINYSTDTVNCSLAIEDDDGLRSTVLISNTAEQLDPPSISDITNLAAGVQVDEISGTRTITISHDGLTKKGNSCGSVNIEYKVYDETDNLKTSGTASGSASVTLTKGKYKITAKATKPYYITSEEYDSSVTGQAPSPNYIWLKGPAIFYVNASGDNINGTGAYDAPYRSIQKAIDEFAIGVSKNDYDASTTCEIRVMSNLTPCDDDTFENATTNALIKTNSSYSYNIHGYGGKYTIDADGSVTNSFRRVINNASSLTIKDLVIKGGYLKGHDGALITGAGIYNTGTLTLDNVTVTGNQIVAASGCDSAYLEGAGILNEGDLTLENSSSVLANKITDENSDVNCTNTTYGAGIYTSGKLLIDGSSIKNNEITSLSPIYGAGLYCGNGTNLPVTLNNAVITGNKGSSITGVYGAGIYTSKTNISISGANTITGNYITGGDSNVDNNLYLGTDGTNQAKLTVTGALTGSRIGITTASDSDVSVSNSVAFTSGYGYGSTNTKAPGAYFTSDTGKCITFDTNSPYEALIAAGGGGINIDTGSSLSLSINTSAIIKGGKVTFTVKDSAAADASDITSGCTYTYIVKTHGDTVPASNYSYTNNVLTLNVPAETYQVYVKATQTSTGASSSAEFTVTVIASGNLTVNGTTYDKTELICAMNASSVTVEGSFDASSNSAFKTGTTTTLSKFEIGKYSVTNELYYAVMGGNAPSSGDEKKPAGSVCIYNMVVFCNKLSLMYGLTPCYTKEDVADWSTYTLNTISKDDGWDDVIRNCNTSANGFRLPTDAEWEFAARGGDPTAADWNYKYAGCNTEEELTNYAWYNANTGDRNPLQIVGQKSPNRLGLYDMSGNNFEFVNNVVSAGSYIRRSGCNDNESKYCQLDYYECRGHSHFSNDGFRLCRTVTE